jgi:uncharacterized hydrophobic protein (TIGR00271 family)
MGLLRKIIDDNTFTPEDIPKLEGKLFWDGPKQRINIERYAVLLFLSTIIASYGVLGDSTATVIGAMIIAPLMVPIVATAAALVMGDLSRAGRSCLLVVAGVIGVICVAIICGVVHTGVISFTNNSQITARASPSLLDLMVALASGVVGAFAVSREDVADSLPGVAISISLVPPLVVTGVSLSQGQVGEALGSLLLFITNFLSILLAGGTTFILLGLSAASTNEMKRSIRRRAFSCIVIGTLLVAVPLAITSFRVAKESHLEHQAQAVARKWLDQTGFDIIKLDALKGRLEIVITGSGEHPALQEFITKLQAKINRDTQVRLKVISSRIELHQESRSDKTQ